MKNSDGQFVTETDVDTGVAIYGEEEASAKIFTTNDAGAISVSGLLDDTYTLVETAAPTDYQLTNTKTEFVVKNGKLAETTGIFNDVDETDLGNPAGVLNHENKPTVNTVTVENVQNYGDYHFVKQDLNTEAPLSGAEFNIAKEKDKDDYLWVKESPATGEYQYAWKSELTDTTGWEIKKLTSGDTGEFDITRLKYGTYYLHETVAPSGYALPGSDFEFTVAKDTAAATDDVIENQPKGILPSTGGMGIIAFVVAGIALIGGAMIYFNKRRQETEA
ncbi:peptidase [Enterococcus sp. JM9B]|nr:peptidase [Enterococcus sp. JM9B]